MQVAVLASGSKGNATFIELDGKKLLIDAGISARRIRQELEGGEEYVAFYDDANRQNTFLTTSTGENVIYTYDQNKKITEILHPDGTKETRVYDAAGNRMEGQRSALTDNMESCFPRLIRRDLCGSIHTMKPDR